MSQHQAPRSSRPAGTRSRRARFVPVALLGGVAATAALALSMTGTLAGFTAQITNSANTTASGTLVMQESGTTGGTAYTCTSTDAGTTSNTINQNTSTCATINKYGGSTTLIPGQAGTQTITMKNTGTVSASTFTLTPGACTQGVNTVTGNVAGNATDFCSKLAVVITQTVGATTTTITPANTTAATLATGGALTLTPLAANASATYNITLTFANTAGNTYQGLAASQPLVWQFAS